MEKFVSHIFEQSKQKTRNQVLFNIIIFAVAGGMIVLFFSGFRLVGIIGTIVFIVRLFQYKQHEDKFNGASAYGDKKAILIIAEEYFVIRDIMIPFSELEDLVIYVDEYTGMPRDFIGNHHGGDNTIKFKHHGNLVEFKYIIKDKADFQKVSRLVARIEEQYPVPANA